MTQSASQTGGCTSRIRTNSTWYRRALSVAAVVTAISPAPVMLFQLVPAYSLQAKFLIFFGPLVCFLTLSYLFYVRDTLARAMFADLLNPPPEPDPYYGEPFAAVAHRVLRRLRSVLLALLPIALLLISAYCAVEYLRLVNRSVAEAVEQARHESPMQGRRSTLREPGPDSLGRTSRARPGRRTAKIAPAQNDSTPGPLRTDSLRQSVLRSAQIDDIPRFARLNMLYIGIFLSAEVAFILMALKEYAKEAIGLTEGELMLGVGPSVRG
jgi:hypothetical protein